MQQAQQGDSAAYQELLGALVPVIRRYLARRLFNKNNIEEITQEILLALHTARHTYLPQLPFDRWLYSIARYKMIDALRKMYRHDNNAETNIEIETFSAISTNDSDDGFTKDLHQALMQLTSKQKDIVTLAKLEGYTAAEVAKKLGMTETAVKVSIHRSLETMRIWLIKNGYE